MALKPRPEGVTDLTRREGCDVRLMGSDWTLVEVLRSLGDVGRRLQIDLKELSDGTHLVASGSPESLLAALTALPVVGTDRDRVIRRLLPLTGFHEGDLRQFRNPSTI